jgi:hypothetical protein
MNVGQANLYSPYSRRLKLIVKLQHVEIGTGRIRPVESRIRVMLKAISDPRVSR